MRKVKKNIKIIIIILIAIILFSVIHQILKQKHIKGYTIKNNDLTFKITEKYTKKNKIDTYYFDIKINDTTYNFKTFENYNKKAKIIKKIYYYEDSEYKCILPVFKKDKLLTDVLCLKNNILVHYDNTNESVKNYFNNIKIYKNNQFKDNEPQSNNNYNIYEENLIKNHYIGLSNYKGIYTVNKNKNNNIQIFELDSYNRPISTIVDKYYLTANYNNKYDFNNFYLINLENNKKTEIKFNFTISFDSFIQGIVKNEVYIYDKSNKKQYKINIKNKTVTEVGNTQKGINYYNLKFTKITPSEAIDKKFKNYETTSNDEYIRIDKIEDYGYYYYYKKIDDYFLVYRANIENKDQLTYLFKTNTINRIEYYKDFIYYVDKLNLMYYHDKYGVKKIITFKELEFNPNLIFGVYTK